MITLLLAALLMGLIGSLHCAGMCGPIIWVMPFQQYSGAKRLAGIGLYHLGRITVYALLGVVLHLFKAAFNPYWQQAFSMIAGITLLATGLLYFLPQLGMRISLPWANTIATKLGGVMQQRHPAWLAAAGALNGLLPCGMVYMALAASVTATGIGQAAALMYAFGLGTVPMLLAITLLRSRIQLRFAVLRRWTPVFLLLFGALFVLRGANLGIPMLSPKAESTTTLGEVKMQCCHKTH